ncbi:Sphingosine-1-phosphate lyase 1 [Chionoecetes opilio]|uniref:Sphingosine-1-phosphate lyase 1 n=1 Tax=Chionoecetes opilio TaxID=41210 RepID=A0A8J5CNU7_CHIOP|nr:Sphingosine-1-phosphate lyase 1 [Chionoecetes opilio]
MYRSHHYLHYQYFVTPNWPGGIYATHTVPGSRAGGLIAVCWASLMYHGFQGYTKVTKGIIATARNLKQRLGQVPGVKVYGDPLTSIVAFHTTEVDILKVGDVLSTKGWHLTFLQYPPGLHVCLTSLQATDDFVDGLVCDLKEAMMEVGTNSATSEGIGKVYGTAASIPDKTMVGEAAKVFLQCYYDTLPDPA